MGNLQLLKKKKKYVLRQVLQIHSFFFFFQVNTHGAHLYSRADVIAFYTSHLVA